MQFMENSIDTEGRVTVGRKERDREKRIILYRWLQEFRIVDIYVVARLLGISRQACQTFMSELAAQGMLKEGFLRLLEGRRKLYCLVRPGYDEWTTLETVSQPYTCHTRMLGMRHIHHHLCVQHAVLDMIAKGGNFRLSDIEAYWEHSLPGDWERRPDALLITPKHQGNGETQHIKVVCEFELTPKSRERMYWIFQTHIQAMRQKKYHAVYLYFANESLKNKYREVFLEEKWPLMTMDTLNYRIKPVFQSGEQKMIDTTQIKGLHGVFHFQLCEHDAVKALAA